MLHGDLAQRRQRGRLMQHPLGQVRVQPDVFHSPALSLPARSQIELDTPSRPKSCTSPASLSFRDSPVPSPSRSPAACASSDTATECPSV